MTRDLREEDELRVGIKRVARLMRQARICGATRRRRVCTTRRDCDGRAAPDRVERDFTASAPNTLWVADITYIPTHAGFLYLAVALDAFSRRVVGWSMASHLRTELVLSALEMALQQRRPSEVIHHSDQGCQYTSYAFGKRCREAGVLPSMGSVGDAYDNALCESFFATLECELLDRRCFRSQVEARMSIFDFIEGPGVPNRVIPPQQGSSALSWALCSPWRAHFSLQSTSASWWMSFPTRGRTKSIWRSWNVSTFQMLKECPMRSSWRYVTLGSIR
jgi:transposase InsO family protein